MRYFKLKLISVDRDDPQVVVLVAARSIGEAVVKTDESFLDSSYRICDATMAEIPEEEFLFLQRQSVHVPPQSDLPHTGLQDDDGN